MNKRKLVVAILSGVILIVAVVMMLGWMGTLKEMIEYMSSAKVAILFLLVPDVILMFYAAGRIWYPYLNRFDLSAGELGAMQYELHFVNTVVPTAALSGLVYATERLKPYGVSAGYAGGMYTYRYLVTVATNWVGIIAAVVGLALMGKLKDLPMTPLILVGVMVLIMVVLVTILLVVAGRQAEFSDTRLGNYLRGLQEALAYAKTDKRALVSSWAWGMLYTILEDLPFLIVAWSMGHPELFLQIIVAAAAGIIVGSLIPTPGGIGGFDGAMIYLLGGLGTSVALASAIVMTTRILWLVGTIATSYFFWQRGMIKIGRAS